MQFQSLNNLKRYIDMALEFESLQITLNPVKLSTQTTTIQRF